MPDVKVLLMGAQYKLLLIDIHFNIKVEFKLKKLNLHR